MKLAFYKAKNGTLYDKLIGLVTLGPYSHCELIFSNKLWFSSSPRDDGVRLKAISHIPENWEFLDIQQIFSLSPTDEKVILHWAESQCGLGYDWNGIYRFIIPFLKPSAQDWFCSEICICALQQVGLLLDLKPYNCSPNYLYKYINRLTLNS